MLNPTPAQYRQILRINPNTKPSILKKFKTDMNCQDKFKDGSHFDLRGITVPPEELVNRSPKDVKSTSSEARKQSRILVKKYRVDNVKDWCREHWKGISENVTFAMWVSQYTLHFNSPEKLHPVLQYLAKKYNIEMYYSHVDDCDTYFEEDCGIAKIGKINEFYELGNDRFELFVFGSILLHGYPISFEEWENEHIPIKNTEKYYVQHFIEENPRNRMKEAFCASNHACLANAMVNESLSSQRIWEALSKLF